MERLAAIERHVSAKTQRAPKVDGAFEFMKLDAMLPEDVAKFRRALREQLQTTVAPHVLGWYEGNSFPRAAVVDAIRQLGPAGMQIHGYGSPGMSHLKAAVLLMELARVDVSLASFYLIHCGVVMKCIELCGTEEQRARWLPRMAAVDFVGSFCLTEPEFGSDATKLKTTARRVPGGWELTGAKRWIGSATVADINVVWARVDCSGAAEGSLERRCHGEVMAFVVEKGSKGFVARKIERKYAVRIIENADITLDRVFVPDSHWMTRAVKFSEGCQKVLAFSRGLVTYAAAGALVGAYDAALRYCVGREQFGRPIAGFQLVQEKLMRTLAACQACALTAMRLADMMQQGSAELAHISLAKAYVSKQAREHIALCREAMGGNGVVLDFGVMKHFMDIEAIYTYEGTYDINMLVTGRVVTGVDALKR